ncbi:MAG: phosphomannomutase/phosphoglucomutase [Actinomycetes bacterium]
MVVPDLSSVSKIFKAYDVRGIVPDQLDVGLIERIGAAFAVFALADPETSGRVLVARDMRESGIALSAAFARGVQSQGLDVVDLGLASTDLLFFASGHFSAPGAMLTASHNPAEYNGIKMCLAGARPIGEDTGLAAIRDLTVAGTTPVEHAGTLSQHDALAAFATHVHGFVDIAALRPMRIIADTANGMGGLVAPAVFEGLPFDVEIMYGELDGTFPNHEANPIQPENQVDLQARVLATGADVGLAFDGDADRVFLVDDKGELVSGSLTTAIVAAAMLEKNPGATILYNLICSKAVPEVITERGGVPVRTRVGHSLIKAVMAETGAAFGGEHSGHYYFRANYRADSGIIAALVVLEVLARSGKPLSQLRIPFERYVASGEINTEVGDTQQVIEAIAERFGDAKQDRLDGLTIDVGDWWFNVRPSNTEPLLRLNLEASTREACDAHVAEIRSFIAEADNP